MYDFYECIPMQKFAAIFVHSFCAFKSTVPNVFHFFSIPFRRQIRSNIGATSKPVV